MDLVEVSHSALAGWRAKVADGLADPVAKRTALSPDAVRALVGVILFGLSVYYVVGTVARAARVARA